MLCALIDKSPSPGTSWLICEWILLDWDLDLSGAVTLSLLQDLWTWTKDERILPISLSPVAYSIKMYNSSDPIAMFSPLWSKPDTERMPKYRVKQNVRSYFQVLLKSYHFHSLIVQPFLNQKFHTEPEQF